MPIQPHSGHGHGRKRSQKRPEIEQSQVGLEDARINMLGTKNNLLPSLSVFANLSNNGLAGSVNTLPVNTTCIPGSVVSSTVYLSSQRAAQFCAHAFH